MPNKPRSQKEIDARNASNLEGFKVYSPEGKLKFIHIDGKTHVAEPSKEKK